MTATMTVNPVAVPFSKRKIFLLLIGAILFVFIGLWLLLGNPTFDHPLSDEVWFIKTMGVASIVFFGFAFCFLIRNLLDKGPGLIIADSGIMDYSSATKIYWKDIEAIEVHTIKSRPIVLFKVNNPQTIDQAKGYKRKMMALNCKWYGTPLGISANSLQISFQDLLKLISERYDAYNNKS